MLFSFVLLLIRYFLNLDSKPVNLQSEKAVASTNEFHYFSFEITSDKLFTLKVDDDIVQNSLKDGKTKNIYLSHIVIGSDYFKRQSIQDFQGSFQKLNLNGNDLLSHCFDSNSQLCTPSTSFSNGLPANFDSAISFQQDTYLPLQIKTPTQVQFDYFHFTVLLKTKLENAVLFHADNSKQFSNSFFTLTLQDGYLSYAYKFSDGTEESLLVFRELALNDNLWHRISIHKNTFGLHDVYVDNFVTACPLSSIGNFTMQDEFKFMTQMMAGQVEVYLGGLPFEKVKALLQKSKTAPKVNQGFIGCVAGLMMNDVKIDLIDSKGNNTRISEDCEGK